MNDLLIVANWKSNITPDEAAVWLKDFSEKAAKVTLSKTIRVILCPPFVDLPSMAEIIKKLCFPFSVELGGQDVSPFPDGSYTGEVSARQLQSLVKYSLVGHSERRKNFQESNRDVCAKLKNLRDNNITSILCAQNLDEIPPEIKNFSPTEAFIMFEPAKAISTDGIYRAETPEAVKETIDLWRKKIGDFRFLYGGSVNEKNCQQLLTAGICGFVVGHASLTVPSFLGIMQNV